ncbi:MAG: hypothetical protein RIQ89_608 [Bacteroidota bacterium]|jgi:hypothetical protein
MDNPQNEDLQALVSRYVSNRAKLIKYELIEKSAVLGGNLISQIIIIFLAFFAFLFLFLALGYWLGTLLGANYLGFGAIALFYLILIVIYQIWLKEKLEVKIENNIVKLMSDENSID